MKRVLVTGVAGFIGSHAARRLLAEGVEVIGIDSLNPYYDPALKAARLATLSPLKGFTFLQKDLGEEGVLTGDERLKGVTHCLHLAAQAGVRWSLEAPFAYTRANVNGHLEVLEWARRQDGLEHLVYASSSSVYGDRAADGAFREDDRCDAPASLYAATKRADEMMSEAYARLYGIPATGLRFFTVYGPWGRPDMAYWIFTEKILRGQPIQLFAAGEMRRDFTFIDDVAGILPVILKTPPAATNGPPHRVVNIGNAGPEPLMALVAAVEGALGIEAQKDFQPRQPGDVTATWADVTRAAALYGYAPKTPLTEGIPHFTRWYRAHFGL
jgi:UDP-glucuronate 4-epimerase